MEFSVLVEQDEHGVSVAEVPALSGCVSHAATRTDALEKPREAIEVHLESLGEHGDPLPPSITEEIVEILTAEARADLPDHPGPGLPRVGVRAVRDV